jgi:hypothetical protein
VQARDRVLINGVQCVQEARRLVLAERNPLLVGKNLLGTPDGRRPALAANINGVSFEEQTEAGLAAGLFGRPLPQRLGMLARTVDDSDPLAELDPLGLPHAVYEPVARLLITERLITVGAVSHVEVAVGPPRAGLRSISAAWRDPAAYSNEEPRRSTVGGRCFNPAPATLLSHDRFSGRSFSLVRAGTSSGVIVAARLRIWRFLS